jgi:hypothetical protein
MGCERCDKATRMSLRRRFSSAVVEAAATATGLGDLGCRA